MPEDFAGHRRSGNVRAAYPAKPAFFAHRLIRKMTKACAAQEIGPEACWLVSIIAHQEDSIGYRRPITYYNEQLMPLLGFGGKDALVNARRRAIEGGFLHYESGRKHKPGTYWTVEPDEYQEIPDSACDEVSDKKCRPETGRKPGNAVRLQDGNPTETPPLSPQENQDTQYIPSSADADGPPERNNGKPASARNPYPADFRAWWPHYPRKVDKGDAAKAYPKAIRHICDDRGVTRKEAQQILIEAADRYAVTVADTEARYIKQPATWLNKCSFDDEPASKPAPTGAEYQPPPPIRRKSR